MAVLKKSDMSRRIIRKAKSLGASLTGFVNIEQIKISPSHQIYDKIDSYTGVGTCQTDKKKIMMPEGIKSAIVLALAHPQDKPELDWWDGRGGTPGNRILIKIAKNLSRWLNETLNLHSQPLPYYVEKGGVFLKDAAVLAGLGCIGKSNLLITPEFGPRVRIRALVLEEELNPTGPIDFNPCIGCEMPCRKNCPQQVFSHIMYSSKGLGINKLPARNGSYSRFKCNEQMEWDIRYSKEKNNSSPCIKYCRRCEFLCPVGNK